MNLQRICRLRGEIQSYAWGSRTALAELLGEPSPSPEPQAELWLGAHPRAPAQIEVDGAWLPLPDAIARAPEAILGSAVAERFGARLPFLLKVLAVARPLSIQAHPDAEQARIGFAREEASGVSLAAPERRYVDPYPKPELICALTAFSALCGFRPADEVRDRLERVDLGELARNGFAIARFFRAWFERDAAAREVPLRRAVEAARRLAPEDAACAWLVRLAAEYAGDPGVLAPLFLNLIELEPGQALFLPPGELHCYLAGTAVEIMASSDNVLRGGLTPKYVDLAELERIVRFASRRPPTLGGDARGAESAYPTPAEEFELSVLESGGAALLEVAGGGGVEILLCVRGRVRVQPVSGLGGAEIGPGASCLVPAAAGPYRVEGRGRVFRAAVPSAASGRACEETKKERCGS